MKPLLWKHEPEDAGHDFDGILSTDQYEGVPTGGSLMAKCDAGNGAYFVLSCDEICFDSAEEFDQWAAMVRHIIATNTETKP